MLAVSYRPVNDLTPYAKNSRTHSERQVEQIAASIKEFGFTQPILVDGNNGVIAGHGRLMAARLIGMDEVPVIELSGLTAAQKRAYVIADNKLTENGGWDESILADELKVLGAEGYDLTLTGFDDLSFVDSHLKDVNFAPGTIEDQGKLDELSPKMCKCPHCGKAFDLREHGQS